MTPAIMTTAKQDQEKAPAPVPYYLRPNEMQREMNSRMAELVPELDSKFARTPMYRSRWYATTEDYEEGTPCFIPAKENEEEAKLKADYVWVPKRRHGLSAGYYHLSTQEAFAQAYDLFCGRIPRRGLRRVCKSKSHQDKIDVMIKNLLYNRFAFDLPPDDIHAARMRIFYKGSAGGRAKAFGRAAYLPTLTSVILLGGLGG